MLRKELTVLMSFANDAASGGPDRFQLEGRNVPETVLNDTIRLLASHRSIRSYTSDPLPDGALEAIVTAAQSASTSHNFQAYTIIAVQEPERKRLLAELSNNAFVADAPLVLVFCADLHRLEMVSRRQGYEFADRGMDMFIQAVVDTALAGQNAAVAAESLGLGVCYVGGIRDEVAKVAEALRLPPRTFALFALTVGYPAKPSRVRHRLPLDVVVHYEVYSDEKLDDGLQRYDETTAASGIYAGRRGQTDKANEQKLYGWCEHTARRLTRPHPKRAAMRQHLEQLGWEF